MGRPLYSTLPLASGRHAYAEAAAPVVISYTGTGNDTEPEPRIPNRPSYRNRVAEVVKRRAEAVKELNRLVELGATPDAIVHAAQEQERLVADDEQSRAYRDLSIFWR